MTIAEKSYRSDSFPCRIIEEDTSDIGEETGTDLLEDNRVVGLLLHETKLSPGFHVAKENLRAFLALS
jgi:hypothetical protein